MKALFTLSVLLVALFPVPTISQPSDEDELAWSASRRLTWADYKGSPDPDSDAAASTTTYLSIEYNIRSDGFTFKIKSRFAKKRSWGRHKTEYILSHEQGHFDIAEIFARKLNKEMSEYRFNNRTYQKDLKKIYDKVTDEKMEMQEDYDRETRHSINKSKQEEWLRKISELLDEYKEWAVY